jgi:transposase
MRKRHGRATRTSLLITDAQSVKNADTAETKGFDGGKLISGIKRHLGVDTEGLPHAIYVTTANVTDRAGALEMVWRYQRQLSRVHKLVVDGGYSGPGFAAAIEGLLGAVVEVAKRSELHRFKAMPKRWVVERDYAWLEKQRRLWKNCERKLTTSEQMIALAFVAILLRRL